jgi:hypothetical protein
LLPLQRYKTQAEDTSIEIDLLLVQRWRELTLEKRAVLLEGLNYGCRQLALLGIQQQYHHPHLIRQEYIRRRLGENYANLVTSGEVVLGNPLELALDIAVILEKLGISYLVGGSVASSFLGEPRATLDLDLVADINLEQVPEFFAILESRFYVNLEAIIEAINNQSSFNLIDLETTEKIDIFILKKQPHCLEEMNRRQKLRILSNPERFLYFPTPEDLIIQKLIWYRLGRNQSDRQWRDILGVLKVQADRLDLNYLNHWAQEKELTELLSQALSEAGLR